MEYTVININDWKKLDKFTIKGRTVKNLFLSSDEKIYLFKVSEKSHGCLNNIRGSHWAEKICSEIGRVLKVNVQNTELAIFEDSLGIICEIFLNIKENEEMIHGQSIMGDDPYEKYTIERILNKIKTFFDEHNIDGYSKFKKDFGLMMLFDWFIGNTDRHGENWGLITKIDNQKLKVRFSPLYDNATSFTNELPIKKVKSILSDKRQFFGYINRARSFIRIESGNKSKYNEMLDVLKRLFSEEYDIFRRKLKNKRSGILKVIEKFPDNIIIKEQKQLIQEVINEKINRI